MAAANLTTCRADLADEKQIAAKDESIIADQNKQLGLKDDEALKKPKGFWKRFRDLKLIGITAGIVARCCSNAGSCSVRGNTSSPSGLLKPKLGLRSRRLHLYRSNHRVRH